MKPVIVDGVIINTAVLSADDVVNQHVKCPACNTFDFEQWPLGWDAHAAHRCKGLSSTTPEVRKKEFKETFAHLFR